MDWTREQIDEMRAGRPMYGDSQKGGALVWLRTAQDTSGEYSLAYGVGKPGYTVFPHYHTGYTETLRVLGGEFLVRIGDQRRTLTVGDEATVPRRTVHEWTIWKEGPAELLVELRPASASFKKWIVMLQNMHADGLTTPDQRPKSIVHAALFLTESDTHPAGRARLLSPVLKMVAWVAHRAGVDRRLEEKYYKPGLLTA